MLWDIDGLHTHVTTEGESVDVRCFTARAKLTERARLGREGRATEVVDIDYRVS
jgi:hypothetical protein